MYRKFTAEQIFTGYEMLPYKAVLLTDDRGAVVDIVALQDAGDDIEYLPGILSPGFVNCHCHLELSHLKGVIPKHTGLVEFVTRVIAGRNAEDATILSAIKNAEDEMLQNGIVAVGDICNTGNTIDQKKTGNLYYHNFIEVSGFPPTVADIRFQRGLELYRLFEASCRSNSIIPHAPYSVSTELLVKLVEFPDNEIFTMHNQEAPAENELFMYKTGDFIKMFGEMGIDAGFFEAAGHTSLQTVLGFFKNYRPLILVHNVFTSEEDIEFATAYFDTQSTALFFCLCPNANLYIGNRLPDVNMFYRLGSNMVLGTDSLASNDQLNIMGEIRVLQKHFPSIPLAELLKWATSNGAKALGISDTYGSFRKGSRPGIIQVCDDVVKRIL